MRLFIFLLFLLFLCAGLSPQLRTKYTPLPIVRPVVKRWRFEGRRQAIQITYVRV